MWRKIKNLIELEEYINYKIKFRYLRKTRKLWSFYPLKDQIIPNTNVICNGKCTCKDLDCGKTEKKKKKNGNSEEMNISHLRKPELGDHLLANPGHNITWKILTKAPAKWKC